MPWCMDGYDKLKPHSITIVAVLMVLAVIISILFVKLEEKINNFFLLVVLHALL